MLAGLRITIGWHFLYEGVAKWMQPGWSAGGYLEASRWLLADLFHWMASTPAVLKVVSLLNIWGLILIGVALILGALTRVASLAGIALLLLYWLANPPLVGLGLAMPAEGHYLVINKNIVEMLALAVVAVMSAGQHFGLDRLLNELIRSRRSAAAGKTAGETPAPTAPETVPPVQPAEEFPEVSARREVLWIASLSTGGTVAVEARIPAIMGTETVLKAVVPKGEDELGRRAIGAAEAELRALDLLLTDWVGTSEIGRINAAPAGATFDLSPHVKAILTIAYELYGRSHGKFDVTCRPLTSLWRAGEARGREPDEKELKRAIALCGWRQFRLREGRLEKLADEAAIDLGGIKGYAVDRAVAAIISPLFVGMIADRFFASEKVMAAFNVLGGGFLYWQQLWSSGRTASRSRGCSFGSCWRIAFVTCPRGR
jgi:thiosulfate dehydrogenase [quinone] large subunit